MFETNEKTKLAAVIGNPIGHSKSPVLHEFLAREMGMQLSYRAVCAEHETLPSVLEEGKAADILGFNITSPFKLDVMALADTIDAEARKMGNVNTMVNTGGKWTGYNTDGPGFMMALERNGILVRDKAVLLLGTGGTARTLSYKFAQAGVKSITISSRRDNVLDDIRPAVIDFPEVSLLEGAKEDVRYDIVVNCTPLGMAPHLDKNPMPQVVSYHKDMVCCDLIYNPAKTLFLQEAEKTGVQILNGQDMFLYQGILAFELFTGIRPTQAVCDKLFAEWSRMV